MAARMVLLLLLVAAAGGCAKRVQTPDGAVYLRSCDDGGDGGVVIDGVCL